MVAGLRRRESDGGPWRGAGGIPDRGRVSFLADPVLLLASGAAIERASPDDDTARIVEGLLLGTFLAMSVPVYLEARWTKPIWRTFGARSGRDFMLNSGLFDFEYRNPPLRTHVAAAMIFATYPLWLHLGRRLASVGRFARS